MPSAAPNHTLQLAVPVSAVPMMQSIAVTENQEEKTERVNRDRNFQTDDDPPAGEELYQNMNLQNSKVHPGEELYQNMNLQNSKVHPGEELYQNMNLQNSKVHPANQSDVAAVEDLYVNKEIINESLLSNICNDSTSNGSISKPELLQQNACIALPEPDYGPVEDDDQKCDEGMMQNEGASCLKNPSSVNKEKEDEEDREDVYSTRDIMKGQYRQSTTEIDLLKDSYWFQPGLPRLVLKLPRC